MKTLAEDVNEQIAEPTAMHYARMAKLSDMETLVYCITVLGLSNREMAEMMSLNEQTVKFHLTNIYRKMGVLNRNRLVAIYYRRKYRMRQFPYAPLTRKTEVRGTHTLESMHRVDLYPVKCRIKDYGLCITTPLN